MPRPSTCLTSTARSATALIPWSPRSPSRSPWAATGIVWRILVDIATNSVLYLRPLSAFVNGYVYEDDPITKTGTTTPTALDQCDPESAP